MEKIIIKAITTVVVVSLLTFSSCRIHADYRVSEAIKNGANPIAARYAFKHATSYSEDFGAWMYAKEKEKGGK